MDETNEWEIYFRHQNCEKRGQSLLRSIGKNPYLPYPDRKTATLLARLYQIHQCDWLMFGSRGIGEWVYCLPLVLRVTRWANWNYALYALWELWISRVLIYHKIFEIGQVLSKNTAAVSCENGCNVILWGKSALSFTSSNAQSHYTPSPRPSPLRLNPTPSEVGTTLQDVISSRQRHLRK